MWAAGCCSRHGASSKAAQPEEISRGNKTASFQSISHLLYHDIQRSKHIFLQMIQIAARTASSTNGGTAPPMEDSLLNNAQPVLSNTRIGRNRVKRKRSGLDEVLANTNNRPKSPIQGPSACFVEGRLCQRCEAIDFQAIFDKPKNIPPLNGLPVLALGNFEPSTSECSLCRLIDAVCLPQYSWGKRRGLHLRLFSSLSILSEKKRSKSANPGGGLSVVHGTALRKEFTMDERRRYSDHGFIVPAYDHNIPTSVQPVFQGHQLNPKRVSYNRLEEWLSHCQMSHSTVCGVQCYSLPFRLKCIDCVTREIGRIDPSDEYLALSYVVRITISLRIL